jgi:hypothetical protein
LERFFESKQFQADFYENSNENPITRQESSEIEEFIELKRAQKEKQKKRGRQCLWKICNWKVDVTQKKSD